MANFQKIAGLHNIGEITRRAGKRNRSRAVLAMVCALMTVTAAGCGETEEPVPVELVSGDMEELQNDIDGDGAQGDDRDGSADAGKENAADDKDDAVDEEALDDAEQENGQNAENSAQDAESDSDAQAQSVGSAELDGDVLSVDGDSFVISKRETYTDGDASVAVGVAPGYEEEEDRITVHVSKGCVWEFQTVRNGGVNPVTEVSLRTVL